MKRNFSSQKWKQHLLRRSIYEEKRHTKKWKDKKKKKKKFKTSFGNVQNNEPNDAYLDIKAPENFSIVNNPQESLYFFKKVSSFLRQGIKVLLDLSEIKTLTPDAITLLIAYVQSVEFHYNTHIKGNAPNDANLRKIFIHSGFYDHVKSKMPKNISNNYLLHKETYNKVEPDIAKTACRIGLEHTLNSIEICEPLYEIIIECMSNTNNHADLKERGIYDWWLFVYRDPISKKTNYTFLDLGIGIFESIPVQNYKRLLISTQLISNTSLVDDLTTGKIKSRTDKPERGRGLPQIFLNSKDNRIKQFQLITNDVFTNFSTGEREKLNYPFNGTLYNWELHPNNFTSDE